MEYLNKNLERITKGTLYVLIGLFISKFLGYIYRIIIARYGAESYGTFILGLMVFQFFVGISLLGLPEGVTRYVSYFLGKLNKSKLEGIISASIKLTLPISVIVSIILWIFSDFISNNIFHTPNLTIVIKILAIALPFNVVYVIFFSILRGFQKIHYEVILRNIIENIIKVFLTFLLIYFGLNLFGISLAFTLSIIFTSVLSFYYLNKISKVKFNRNLPNMNKKLLIYSLPLLFSSFTLSIITWADTFLIGYFKNTLQVGIYNVALPTAQMLYLFPYSVSILFLPVLTKLYAENKKEIFISLYKTITKWIILINIPILLIFIFFSKEIIKILFGNEYITSFIPLIILSIGFFICYLVDCSYNILLILKKTKLICLNIIIALISNIILNIILIPPYGIVGAAIATTISFSLIGILVFIESFIFTKVSPIKLSYLLMVVLISLISLSISLIIHKYIIIKDTFIFLFIIIIIFLSVYISLLFVTKLIDKRDKLILDMIKRKLSSKSFDKIFKK